MKFLNLNARIILLVICIIMNAGSINSYAGDSEKKTLYLPVKIDRIPEGNNFNDNNSEFSYKRMVESENLALFWHKEYGDDPMSNPDDKKRFDVQKAITECERFYRYYVDELKLVVKGNSLTDKYKMLIIVFGGDEGTAYGGGEEDKVGILWTPAVRISKFPYGALAHELGHSFQYISSIDSKTGPGGALMEMSAQYMLWQVYPDWMTFENYHLTDFMKGTHYAFLHTRNMYHSPYVLEYWSEKHGKDFFGKLCRTTLPDEDPVTTYKRINKLNQEQFNDELFDAYRHFITWDLKRVEKEAHQYANQHQCKLNRANDWYKIAASNCPQNYGYNGIKLVVPAVGSTISVQFEGIAGSEGYNAVKTDKAGWRYGFMASLKNGNRVYDDVYRNSKGSASFKVPENTEYLWLVVSGAPTEHWPVIMSWGPPQPDDQPEEQWPYQIKLTGTSPDPSFIN